MAEDAVCSCTAAGVKVVKATYEYDIWVAHCGICYRRKDFCPHGGLLLILGERANPLKSVQPAYVHVATRPAYLDNRVSDPSVRP